MEDTEISALTVSTGEGHESDAGLATMKLPTLIEQEDCDLLMEYVFNIMERSNRKRRAEELAQKMRNSKNMLREMKLRMEEAKEHEAKLRDLAELAHQNQLEKRKLKALRKDAEACEAARQKLQNMKACLEKGKNLLDSGEIKLELMPPRWDDPAFWEGQHTETVEITRYQLKSTTSGLEFLDGKMLETVWSSKIQLRKAPFSKGVFRFAKYCKLSTGENMVVKEPLTGSLNLEEDLKESVSGAKAHQICRRLASTFNFRLCESSRSTPAEIVDFVDVQSFIYKDHAFVMEPFIEGQYMRFNNNAGYVNESPEHLLPQTFSHWSWEFTEQRFIVVDLQGVKKSVPGLDKDLTYKYLLTDPAIHSVETADIGCFDGTQVGNSGKNGVNAFFESHNCNKFCCMLKLRESESVLK